MGWGIVLKSIGRYIRFGKQIGKTAKNGAKVYKRGKTLTGVDKDGNVIRTVKKFKSGEHQVTTVTKTPIPFASNGRQVVTESRLTQTREGTEFYRSAWEKDNYSDRHYDTQETPWYISWSKNRKTGEIHGRKIQNNPDYTSSIFNFGNKK